MVYEICGNVVNLSRDCLLCQRANGVGTKTEDAGFDNSFNLAPSTIIRGVKEAHPGGLKSGNARAISDRLSNSEPRLSDRTTPHLTPHSPNLSTKPK
ncbi:hypothetical protein TNCV_2419341 [Trichonephila clavipes]|nr:hypothetical protein TNCV_2419341 [Trichonephila clavipes]